MKLAHMTSILLLLLFIMPIIACNENAAIENEASMRATSAAEIATLPETSAADTPTTTENTTAVTTSSVCSTAPSASTTLNKGDDTYMPPQRNIIQHTDVKAMWLSQFDLNGIYTHSGKQRAENDFALRIKKILKNVKDMGFNTVFLQVRPNADSMYPSEYYPMSKYVVGSYGKYADYDPVGIVVEVAHALGLSIHAWINPMRAMTLDEIKSVSGDYAIKKWYDGKECGKYIVANGNNYYLNPAYDEVRNLIIDGAAEILGKYAFDGLHMDDYFYPTDDASFDRAAYAEYKANGGKLSLEKFRMDELNKLIAGLYAVTKACDERLPFGISPAGNINNVRGDFADVDTWCASEGYIDYICPQVYFGLEHQTYDFKSVCKTWQNIIRNDKVDLIIGMTFGKAKSETDQWAGSGKDEWKNNKDVLKRCLEYTDELKKCTGISVFCYQYFYVPITGVTVSETAEEAANFLPTLKEISWR